MKPVEKVSFDHCMSREPGFSANDHGHSLKRAKDSCRTIIVDHTSDYDHHFAQASTKGSQTAEAKYKFENFAKKCGVQIQNFHADNKIFNEQMLR